MPNPKQLTFNEANYNRLRSTGLNPELARIGLGLSWGIANYFERRRIKTEKASFSFNFFLLYLFKIYYYGNI